MIPRRHTGDDRRRRLGMIIRRCRTLTAVLVVEHLSRLEAKHDRVTPSREGIAQAIGRCERSVSRAVGELEAAGAVDVWRDRPHGRKDGTWTRRRTNLYRLKWPPKVAKDQVGRKGHALPVYAFHKAIEPTGGAHSSAAPASEPIALSLFTAEPDPPEPVVPPPWVTEGIDRAEWVRRLA